MTDRVNERLTPTTRKRLIRVKHMIASLVIIKINGTESQEQDTSSRSGNDAHVDDAIIYPVYNEDEWLEEKGFAVAALKNELRKLTGNSVNTKFAKPSILGKPVLQPHRNQPRSSMFKRRLIAADQASVFMAMTSVHISSGLVLYQMTSDHNRSELRIQDHSNEQSSSKLVPKVVP
ncbi:hypothetical protein Tco_1386854 [Tanacetum coccineum]